MVIKKKRKPRRTEEGKILEVSIQTIIFASRRREFVDTTAGLEFRRRKLGLFDENFEPTERNLSRWGRNTTAEDLQGYVGRRRLSNPRRKILSGGVRSLRVRRVGKHRGEREKNEPLPGVPLNLYL